MAQTKILDSIDNKIGSFYSSSVVVPSGMNSVTIKGDLPAQEIIDTTDVLRIGVEADFGAGFQIVQWGDVWQGHPGQVAPKTTWNFNSDDKPIRVRGILENITQVIGGLTISFSSSTSQPITRQWWKASTAQMAFDSWLQAQSRSGIENSPVFIVPSGATGITCRIIDNNTFINPSQLVQLRPFASFNDGQTYEEYGGASPFPGGLMGLDKNGNQAFREIGVGFPTDGKKPDHFYIQHEVWGTVNFGVNVQWEGV